MPAATNLRRRGKHWEVEWNGDTIRLRHSVALFYLAELLRRPGRRLHVIELLQSRGSAAVAAPDAAYGGMSAGELERESLHIRPAVQGEPLLDRQSLRAYKRRLRELSEERADAEQHGDAARLEAIDAEAVALKKAFKHTWDDKELNRIRNTVNNAIRREITAIGRQHKLLGLHLSQAIHGPKRNCWWYEAGGTAADLSKV